MLDSDVSVEGLRKDLGSFLGEHNRSAIQGLSEVPEGFNFDYMKHNYDVTVHGGGGECFFEVSMNRAPGHLDVEKLHSPKDDCDYFGEIAAIYNPSDGVAKICLEVHNVPENRADFFKKAFGKTLTQLEEAIKF